MVTISGGTVTATGGTNGAGICAGSAGTGTVTISGGTVYTGGAMCDLGSGLTDKEETLSITDTAMVFLKNNSCTTPATTTHTNSTYSIGTTEVYGAGISVPDTWTADFGAYLPLSTLSYDVNGGSGSAPSPVTQLTGTTAAAVQSDGFSYAGHVFSGWNTAADVSGGVYQPGDTLTFGNDDVTLYAQWIEILSTAGISGITAPAAGAAPQTAGGLTAGHSGYTVTNLTWQNSDGSPATLTDGRKFKAASTYKAVIELTAAADCRFQPLTPSTDTGMAAAGTVNTNSAGNTLTFTVSFPATAESLAAQPGAPMIQSAVAGNGQASLSWSEVPATVSYNIYSSTTSGLIYTIPSTTVAGAVYSCDVTGLTNGTAYYFAVTAVGPGGESAYSNEVSATPRTVPGAPDNIIATAGDGQATVNLTPPADNGGNAITGYTVTSSPGNITAAGITATITVKGLTNGTAYTFTVKAANAAGTGPVSPASNAVTPFKPSSGDSDGNNTSSTPATPTHTANTGVDILVNGKTETAANATNTQEGDKTVTTVVVDDKKIEERLVREGSNAVVTIPVLSGADIAVGQLSGQTIKNMENKDAVLEIKTGLVTYTIPASQINIDAVSEQIGRQVELKDITVSVKISEPTADTVKIVEDTANKNNYQIVVKPVEFEITCSSGNKTVEVSKFNAYVERLITIPEGVDPSKITTGIVLNEDGTFSHVPTVITVIDGKYYAKINSLTNSVYSIISSPKTFADVENHWAKEAVNDMASRLVMVGIGEDKFEPDRSMTRAEFAAVVVRALGLMRPGVGKDTFNDVTKADWYYDAVSIAYEYGIISGYGSHEFGPTDKVTREQTMIMIARAMDIIGLKMELANVEADKLLENFSDAGETADYAKDSIAVNIKAEIAKGKNGKALAPKDNITRAETAAIIRRLLQASGLI